jgi:hypothetical protein
MRTIKAIPAVMLAFSLGTGMIPMSGAAFARDGGHQDRNDHQDYNDRPSGNAERSTPQGGHFGEIGKSDKGAALMGVRQDRTASPSRWMVQAPQAATPHPNFVPVRPSSSRSNQSNGIEESPSNVTVWPLTRRVSIISSLVQRLRKQIRLLDLRGSYCPSPEAIR